MVVLSNQLIDQFHVKDGWHYCEDISFHTQVAMSMTLAQGQQQTVPITFTQPPLRSFNQIPEANSSFLVLRHLDVASERPALHREGQWQWVSDSDATFTALGNTVAGTVTLTFLAGPVPSGLAAGQAVPVALRRIQLGTLPPGVTITKVEVRPDWSATYDNLNISGSISGTIDLGNYYHSVLGIVNDFTQVGVQTQIDVRLTYSNTNPGNTSVPYQFFGSQKGQQWGQWLIQFQPSYGGSIYDIGQYDDINTPARNYQLDKLIPIQLNDMGITNLGNLVFTNNQQIPFYANFTEYDIMLTMTVAYLEPIG